MKKSFSYTLFFLFSSFMYAQNELALYGVWEGEIFKKDSGEFFYLTSGAIKTLDKNIEPLGFTELFRLKLGVFMGQDSSVMVFISTGGSLVYNSVKKYDKDWNEVGEYDAPVWKAKYGGELSNSTIVLGEENNDNLVFFDTLGNEIWSGGANGEITDIYIMEGDTVVSIANGGLSLFSANGDLIATFPNYNFSHTVPINNGQWVGQKEDTLFLLSPSFELIGTTTFPNVEVLDIEAGYGKVVLLGDNSMVYIFDESLSFQNSFMLSDANLNSFQNFELAEDGIIVAGGTKYGASDYATFFKKFLWDGTGAYTENNDIGIVAVDMGNEFSIYPFSGQWATADLDTVYQLLYHNVVLTVKNYGETTVESLTINTFFPHLFVGIYDQTELFNGNIRAYKNNVNIEPGEEKNIGIWLSLYFVEIPNGELYNQCFWTSRPNNRIDDSPDNDAHCFELIVSTNEEFEPNPAVSVFPSPSNGKFHISLNEPTKNDLTWILYDQFGRKQFTLPLDTWQSEYTVFLPHLPDGIYYWKVHNKERLLNSGKLVVLR